MKETGNIEGVNAETVVTNYTKVMEDSLKEKKALKNEEKTQWGSIAYYSEGGENQDLLNPAISINIDKKVDAGKVLSLLLNDLNVDGVTIHEETEKLMVTTDYMGKGQDKMVTYVIVLDKKDEIEKTIVSPLKSIGISEEIITKVKDASEVMLENAVQDKRIIENGDNPVNINYSLNDDKTSGSLAITVNQIIK